MHIYDKASCVVWEIFLLIVSRSKCYWSSNCQITWTMVKTLICVRCILANFSCSGELSWTHWAFDLLSDLCSVREECCGTNPCCGNFSVYLLYMIVLSYKWIGFHYPSSVFLHNGRAWAYLLMNVWALTITFFLISSLCLWGRAPKILNPTGESWELKTDAVWACLKARVHAINLTKMV